MSSVCKTLLDSIEWAVEPSQDDGFAKATQHNELDNHSPLNFDECDRFLRAIDKVEPSDKPMLLQHYLAFHQLRSLRVMSRSMLIAEQVQIVYMSSSATSSPGRPLRMDPVTLAAAAVTVLAPYLAKAGEGAAKKIGENAVDAGGKLLGWIRSRLGEPGQEALNDLTEAPDDGDNQAVMRKQLAKALQTNPALAAELEALLPTGAQTDSMTQHVSGAGAKAVQVKGSGNTTTIG